MATSADTYLLLVRETTPEAYDGMSPAERQASLDRWNAWVDLMAATGKLHDGQPLEPAARLVSGTRGQHVVDGPFTEAKEVVGGFFLLTDLTLAEATQMAQACPNLRYGMTVEIRPVAGACHLAKSLGRKSMREPHPQAPRSGLA